MIRAVIFDWGGVLMRTVDASPRLAWDARLGLGPGSVNRLVFKSPMWRRAQLGQISDAAFWADLGVRLNLSSESLAEFRRDFWAGDRLDGDLVALIRSLRPRYKTALLSNFSGQLRQLLTQHGLIDAFDVIVISGEEGLLKPDARIYHLAAERLGVPVADCLFVDDFEENVTGARAAGMPALHFASFSSCVLCLSSELGVAL
jgi:epoxide hydrolase-like predicted phosphatase